MFGIALSNRFNMRFFKKLYKLTLVEVSFLPFRKGGKATSTGSNTMIVQTNPLECTTLVVLSVNGEVGEIYRYNAYSHVSADRRDKTLMYFEAISDKRELERELPRRFKINEVKTGNTPLECYMEIDELLVKLGVPEGARKIANCGDFAKWLEQVCS